MTADIIMIGLGVFAVWVFFGLVTAMIIDANTRLTRTEVNGVIILWPIFAVAGFLKSLLRAVVWFYESVRDALRLLTF